MGVNGLWEILNDCASEICLDDLKGAQVAVDASIWIYQLSSIQSDSSFVCEGLFRRLCRLFYFGIQPIFVFDGRPSELKLKTTRKRNRTQKLAQKKIASLAKKALALRHLTNSSSVPAEVKNADMIQVSDEDNQESGIKDSSFDFNELDSKQKRIAGSSYRVYEFVKSSNNNAIIEKSTETSDSARNSEPMDSNSIDFDFEFEDIKSESVKCENSKNNNYEIQSEVTPIIPVTSISQVSAIVPLYKPPVSSDLFDEGEESNSHAQVHAPVALPMTPEIKSNLNPLDLTMKETVSQTKVSPITLISQAETACCMQSLGLSESSQPNISTNFQSKEIRKLARSVGYRLDFEAIMNFKSLICGFGFSWIAAPAEAEAQCVALQKCGVVDYVISDDSDAFLFGASKVIRNCFCKTKSPKVYDIGKSSFSQETLIFLGSLLGTDYFEGINGIGPKKALVKLSLLHSSAASAKACFETLMQEYSAKDKEYSSHQDFLLRSFYRAYKFPVTDTTEIRAKQAYIDDGALLKFMCANTQISENSLKKELALLHKYTN